MSIKIDPKIKTLVKVLNKIGFPTTGSCQGHVDYGHPAPWVKITPKNKVETDKLLKSISGILAEFYKINQTRKDARIVVQKGNAGFWIHNGGGDYEKSWNAMLKRVKTRESGKIIENAAITLKERSKRKVKLPLYQKEMEKFAKFLGLNNRINQYNYSFLEAQKKK